jgi:hypothetical protein
MEYCRGRDHIAMAGCQAVSITGDTRLVPKSDGVRRAELIRQKYVHLGMYLIDDVVMGPPTTAFINRRAVEAGGVMAEESSIRYYTDSRWLMEVLRHGDSALIHEPLVEYFQGEHVSLSSDVKHRPQQMDDELLELRGLMRDAIPPDVAAPSLATVKQMILVMRAFSQLKAKHPWQALRRAVRAWRPGAWYHVARFVLRKRFPGRFHDTPREILLPVDSVDSSTLDSATRA